RLRSGPLRPERPGRRRLARRELAARFVDDDRDRVREVQAADVWARDRDAVELGRELLADRWREAARLAAEDEHVVGLEADVGVDTLRARREGEAAPGHRGAKGFPARV